MHALFLALLLPAADAPRLIKPTPLTINTKADEDEPNLSSSGLRLGLSNVKF